MKDNDIKLARRLQREQDLRRKKVIGFPRAHQWGGKPGPREDRRSAKVALRKFI
tara:strand:+ start:863 stop:1024 length:162 start_codon:yes stop_codon:yes gene_type:complete